MLISASFTPFHPDYTLNLDLIDDLYQNLRKQKVAGTMIGGTTGEGYSMSNSERKILVESWRNSIEDDFKLYAHVGHNSIPDIKELSRHAISQDVEGLVLSAPTFFKPGEVEDLVLFLKESIVDTSGIKIYYYHIPSLTGVNFSMACLLELAEKNNLELTGIKFTHDDLQDFEKCLHYKKGKYDMMFGQDENYLDALNRGASVALGSTYNYMARIFQEIKKAYDRGDAEKAIKRSAEARNIIDILTKYGGGVIGGKAFMNLIGLDCGPVRLPLRSLTENQMSQLRTELEKTTFFEYTPHSKHMKI